MMLICRESDISSLTYVAIVDSELAKMTARNRDENEMHRMRQDASGGTGRKHNEEKMRGGFDAMCMCMSVADGVRRRSMVGCSIKRDQFERASMLQKSRWSKALLDRIRIEEKRGSINHGLIRASVLAAVLTGVFFAVTSHVVAHTLAELEQLSPHVG